MANRLFYEFGKENVGKFTTVNISYFSKPGIWLGKILANSVCFAKFIKVFPCQNLALYIRYFMRLSYHKLDTTLHGTYIAIAKIHSFIHHLLSDY